MHLSNRLALRIESKEEIYYRAMIRLIDTKGPIDIENKDVLKQFCFICIKYINAMYKQSDSKEKITLEHADAKFNLIYLVMDSLAQITPEELMQMFPVTKQYNGSKFEMKDYFTTMEDIKKYPMDVPIGRDNVFSLLWDYLNWELNLFLVEYMSAMSDLNRLHKGNGIIEEFFKENNVQASNDNKSLKIMSSESSVIKSKNRVSEYISVIK